jgi:hypothetical protein
MKSKLTLFALAGILSFSGFAQTQVSKTTKAGDNESKRTQGVAVSPAHFHLNISQGETKTFEITVSNDTDNPKSFKVNTYDFDMDGRGKSNFLPAGDGKYSLSKWLNVSPSFVECNARETKKVKLTVSVPEDESGARAAWNIIMLEEEKPRTTLEPPKKGEGTVALGVIPTFAFGVFVYQNPPNVTDNAVEITNFTIQNRDETTFVSIEAENRGSGIAYCTSYIDLTNLETGEQERLTVKRFTIVPELIRDFNFTLPDRIGKGKYLAVGVLDFEGSEEIQVAEMEFDIN